MFGTDSEKQLARRLRSGDSAAIRDFYALYARRLTAVCSRYLGHRDEVKDVMQESMISLIQHIGQFEYRGRGSLLAWATRIVVSQCILQLKQEASLSLVPLDHDVGEEALTNEEPPVDDIPPEVLQRFIQELPPGYRTVFNLYVMEGKSHQEIAALLNIREDTSASQLHRAKNSLARKIKEYRTLYPKE